MAAVTTMKTILRIELVDGIIEFAFRKLESGLGGADHSVGLAARNGEQQGFTEG
jgi:hypothetical protein